MTGENEPAKGKTGVTVDVFPPGWTLSYSGINTATGDVTITGPEAEQLIQAARSQGILKEETPDEPDTPVVVGG